MPASYFAAVEAGGTKFNCAFGTGYSAISEYRVVATAAPEETLAQVNSFFNTCADKYAAPAAMGIASFGPVGLKRDAPDYGRMLVTPKPGWSGIDILGGLARPLQCPAGFDTDVNGAALGELEAGAAQGLDTFAYVTVGTGVGVGVIVNGRPLHGMIHPEFGHLLMPLQSGHPAGVCEFHGNCISGLVCGPAIARRWGQPARALPADHPAWAAVALDLARFCFAITLAYSPQKIILGGGVMKKTALLARVQRQFGGLVSSYLPVLERAGGVENFICAPGLDDLSGITGAFVLAQAALRA